MCGMCGYHVRYRERYQLLRDDDHHPEYVAACGNFFEQLLIDHLQKFIKQQQHL